jgi:hypothetical protein
MEKQNINFSKVTNFEIGDLVLMPYWSDVPEGYTSGWGTYSEYNIVTDAKAQEKDGIIPAEFAYGQRKLPNLKTRFIAKSTSL